MRASYILSKQRGCELETMQKALILKYTTSMPLSIELLFFDCHLFNSKVPSFLISTMHRCILVGLGGHDTVHALSCMHRTSVFGVFGHVTMCDSSAMHESLSTRKMHLISSALYFAPGFCHRYHAKPLTRHLSNVRVSHAFITRGKVFKKGFSQGGSSLHVQCCTYRLVID